MSARLDFTVIINTTSDWAIGIGSGRQGSIDRLIARDADRLPYMPATTLRGLWRDAAEQLAFALDDGASGGWTDLLPRLFGSQPALDDAAAAAAPPVESRLQTADARMPEDQRAYLRHEQSVALVAALVYVRPGVAIDAASGTARTDFLRFEEVAREGIVLVAECSIALPGGGADAALAAFAIGALRLIERMGGKRRRGAGRCSIEVQVKEPPAGLPDSFAAAAEVLARTATAPAVAASGEDAAVRAASYRGRTDGSWRRYPLTVTLKSPVVVPHDVLGNVVTTHDFIPGTMLLPIVTRMLAGAVAPGLISASIANGDIRVLPAYPGVRGQRALPTPCVWQRQKDDNGGPDGKGKIRNSFVQTSDDGVQWKPERDGFFALAGNEATPAFATVPTSVRTHNSVDDLRQKPTNEAGGGVYSYESLDADQIFLSELWIRDGIAGELEPAKIRGDGRIGRAKNAGYGFVNVSLGPLLEDLAVPKSPGNSDEEKKFIYLFAASDIVLRFGPRGKPLTALLEALRSEYKIDAELAKEQPSGDLRFRRHEGWIARWNLQRPSLTAIKAGSALKLRLRAPDPDVMMKLAELQNGGLGERRGEGFGHILINHPALTDPITQSGGANERTMDTRTRPAPPASFAKLRELLEIQAAKVEIRLAAEAKTAEALQHLFHLRRDNPTMSQLGALRAVIGDLSSDDDQLRTGCRYLASREGDAGKGAAWIHATSSLFAAPASVWTHLRENRDDVLFSFAQDPGSLDGRADLQRYAIASLFHAAMRAHKRASERQERRDQAGAAAAE